MSICPWVVEDPLCCDCWNAANPARKAQAITWATSVMYARTGRQFGVCPITVRPCGYQNCGNGLGNFWGWGWQGSTWTPYLWNGQWFNCICPGVCCCDPDQQVRLDGPVQSIISVTISGVVLDPAAYRVDNYQWLVRQDGGRWPQCPNMDNPAGGENVFEVTYAKGRAVPEDVLQATAILACEYEKRCAGDSSCRLSSRIVSMTRQGADFQFVAPEDMLRLGLTGINEVDEVIANYNPHGLKAPLRVFAPELRWPRMQTWP